MDAADTIGNRSPEAPQPQPRNLPGASPAHPRRGLSIRWKLILSISIPLLLTYLGVLAFDYFRQRSTAQEQMQDLVEERAGTLARELDARMRAAMILGQFIASALEATPEMPRERLDGLLAANVRPGTSVVAWGVIFEPKAAATQPGLREPATQARERRHEAVLVRRYDRNRRIREVPIDTYPTFAWYQRCAAERKPLWSDPYVDGLVGRTHLASFTAPILVNDAFRGAAVVFVNLDELRQSLSPRQQPARVILPNAPPPAAPRPQPQRAGTSRPSSRSSGKSGRFERFADRFPPPAPPEEEFSDPAPTTEPAVETDPGRAIAAVGAGSFVIIDHDGHFISHPDSARVGAESLITVAENRGQFAVADAAREATASTQPSTAIARAAGMEDLIPGAPDQYHWIAFAPIPSTGWAFVASVPESRLMAPILQRLWHRAAFLLAGSVVMLGIVTLVSIRISRPIERLAGAVDELARGNMDVQVAPPRGRDEVAQLAGGFNAMVRQLNAHIDALTAETAAREKVESELRIARRIQADLLPRTWPAFPERTEFDLYGQVVPAAHVAGDFFDFFFTPAGLLTLVIADVSGKGVPAALLMAVTRTTLRDLAMANLSPAKIIEQANASLTRDISDSMFVTLFLAQYDPATGRLRYVNAGHPPPLRLAPDQPPATFGQVTAPILGVTTTAEMGPIREAEDSVAPGQSLLLYTDGVTEARSPAGHMLTTAGLLELVTRQTDTAPEPLCRQIVTLTLDFQSDRPGDDITVLALRRSPRPASSGQC